MRILHPLVTFLNLAAGVGTFHTNHPSRLKVVERRRGGTSGEEYLGFPFISRNIFVIAIVRRAEASADSSFMQTQ